MMEKSPESEPPLMAVMSSQVDKMAPFLFIKSVKSLLMAI
jgi:hypothetical protein